MPVQINFLEEGIGVEFISSGIVTGEEIIAANQELYTREILLRLKYKVIDRTSCTDYRVTTKDIEVIASQDRAAAKIKRDITIVLVSPTDLLYGMTRMWQAYIDDIGFDSQIFANRTDADAYLKEKFAGSGE